MESRAHHCTLPYFMDAYNSRTFTSHLANHGGYELEIGSV
jgi:hypothetical protein